MSNPSTLPEFAWAWLLAAEGGFSAVQGDAGGRTQYGISERWHPGAWMHGPPSAAQARAIYARDYWGAYYCGELDPHCGLMLLDLVVQHPAGVAIKLWQQCVGAQPYDGILGAGTRRAGNKADWRALQDPYFHRRALHYTDIVRANSSQAPFLGGWLNRLFRLQRYLLLAL